MSQDGLGGSGRREEEHGVQETRRVLGRFPGQQRTGLVCVSAQISGENFVFCLNSEVPSKIESSLCTSTLN